MKSTTTLLPLFALFSVLSAAPVAIPSGIDHSDWSRLLEKYVDPDGFVDYRGWAASTEDRERIRQYLAQFEPAPASPEETSFDYRVAALANAYNAFTIEWILRNFPVASIRQTKRPWKAQRHRVGGRLVSLDEIEHDTLRPLIGWKVHSMVVCAARSCPPLQREAFTPENWEAQMRRIYRIWLGRPDLNRWDPADKSIRLSKIFSWYREDFSEPNSIPEILRRFAPESYRNLPDDPDFRIRYLDYHWGLNAQSSLGKDYNHGWF